MMWWEEQQLKFWKAAPVLISSLSISELVRMICLHQLRHRMVWVERIHLYCDQTAASLFLLLEFGIPVLLLILFISWGVEAGKYSYIFLMYLFLLEIFMLSVCRFIVPRDFVCFVVFSFPQQCNILKDRTLQTHMGCKWEHNEKWFPFLDPLVCLNITDCHWKTASQPVWT